MNPPALATRPELDYRQVYFYNAYQDISRGRPVGMAGPLAIPVSEILAYCNLFYISQINERERLHRYVTGLDNAYLDHVAKQQKTNSSK